MKISYPDLPIVAHKEAILAALKTQQVIIVAGEPGSGKTTQLPKLCLEAGLGATKRIGHTQPRRLAAKTVATRIAQELNVPLGRVVGYKMRFADKTAESTQIKLDDGG